MFNLFDYPALLFALALPTFWGLAHVGAFFRARRLEQQSVLHEDLAFILGAALTLLGLIIGFTFSMAVSRYDQRKNLEEEEANAIGTEYLRASLLPAGDATRVRALLRDYTEQRLLKYTTHDESQLKQIASETARLQNEMWVAVTKPVAEQPALIALVIAGMNDVLNSQGYTQAAWWNRIPTAAWVLVLAICVLCNVLVGYVVRGRSGLQFMILPIALAICLSLIADIDSPRRGLIHVRPQNLESLARGLHSQ